MKILVDINHPGHVHFFKNLVWTARSEGHEVVVVASEKDQTSKLLTEYQIPYVMIGSYGKSLGSKMLTFLLLNIRLLFIVLKHRPDVLIGIASFRCAQVAWLTRRPAMIFDDTEHSTLEIAMYKPFANRIFTPSCFTKDLGRKQVRYPSYHELAYLHPSRFTPNPEVLTELGLHVGEKFFVVRFVSWSAGHDIGQCGLSLADKARLVQLLAKHGRVLITAEGELPEPLKQYGISLSPGKIHDLLSFAHMYVGEGGTMATESAVLGVPSILINPLRAGNFDELVERYGLLRQCSDIEEAYAAIERLLENEGLIKVWKERRSKLLQEKVDASEFLIDEVLRGSRSAELAFLPRVVGS